MAFHEVQFPTKIAYGSSGGPVRKTDIITLDSGHEQRNTPWSQSRREYNVAYGTKTYDDLYALMAFWEARNGPLYGFRYKDWMDFKSCPPQMAVTATDQIIGVGDGVTKVFQLIKTYSSGGYDYVRTITKPVVNTVVLPQSVLIDDAGDTLLDDEGNPLLDDFGGLSIFTVDSTTGLITFDTAPAVGVVITAGFEFDVPVRFASDKIAIDLKGFERGEMPDIMLQELRI